MAVQRVKQRSRAYSDASTCQMFEAPESGWYMFSVPCLSDNGSGSSLPHYVDLVRNGGPEAEGAHVTSWRVPEYAPAFAVDSTNQGAVLDAFIQPSNHWAVQALSTQGGAIRYCMWLDARDQLWAVTFAEVPCCVGVHRPSEMPVMDHFA